MRLLWSGGKQRIHLLRKLNSFSVSPVILCHFYQSFIESPSFSFICWFHSLTVKDRNSLNSIVKICSNITGVKQRDLNSSECSLLPSERCYVLPACKANRYSKSFILSSIRLLHSLHLVVKSLLLLVNVSLYYDVYQVYQHYLFIDGPCTKYNSCALFTLCNEKSHFCGCFLFHCRKTCNAIQRDISSACSFIQLVQ